MGVWVRVIAAIRLEDLYSLWNSDKAKKSDIICLKGMKVCFCVWVCAVYEHLHVSVWDPCQLFFPVKKTTATGNEEASMREDDLFTLLLNPTDWCSLLQRWTHMLRRIGCEVRAKSDGAEIRARTDKDTHLLPSSGISSNKSKQCGRADSTYYTTSP